MERRLAAILATDVVGYSRMMADNEEATLAALKVVRAEIIEPFVSRFDGRVVKHIGDGTLVEFASAVNATECAVAMQMALVERDGPIHLRIGLHLGDIIVDDNDVYGDGVNVAARLEPLAETDGVCISDMVLQNVRAQVDLRFVDMGEQDLKNITHPVKTWHWSPGKPGAPATLRKKRLHMLDKPAIAVMPFKNRSGDPDQEYFSDGLTDDLITAISHWRTFPVIARNSTFAFKDQALKTAEIADELGARYILDGSVRTAGNRVRVSASLVDAIHDHEVWTERFDGTLDDIFDVQDQITNQVATVVGHEIEQAELSRIARRRDRDPTAWDLLIQANHLFLQHSCDGNAAARKLYSQAIDINEDYGDAWAYLGWTHSHDIMQGCVEDTSESASRGMEAAQRAVGLNNRSSLAHLVLGSVYVWTGDLDSGLRSAQKALELNPNDVRAGFAVGNRLTLLGEFSKGIEMIETMMRLNPSDPFRWHYHGYLSRAYLSTGDVEAATMWADEAVRLRPDQPDPHFRQALCRAHAGQVDAARGALELCDQLEPGFVERKRAWEPYPDRERNAFLLGPLRQANLL